MKVLLTGGSGFIGQALHAALNARGASVHILTRNKQLTKTQRGTFYWNPATQRLDMRALEGVDAVVHLAGESILGRWTPKKRAAILESRVAGTTLLAETLADMQGRGTAPKCFISASAIGIYGNDFGANTPAATEATPITLPEAPATPASITAPGNSNFLREVCTAWEGAASAAAEAGIPTVHPRIGVVLGPSGGALKQMLPPFKLGVGGKLGSGGQWMSALPVSTLVEIFLFLIDVHVNENATATAAENKHLQPLLTGQVNCTHPAPLTNAAFTKLLGKILKRPTLLPVPAFALNLLFGKHMAGSTLLASQNVVPGKLLSAGFNFTPHVLTDLESQR